MTKIFVDSYYDNASPLAWDFDGDALTFTPIADHERFKGNFQATTWNFRIVVSKESIGKVIRIKLQDVKSCWNGRCGSDFNVHGLTSVVSRDSGKTWETIIMDDGENGEKEFQLLLDAPVIQVAKLTPYTIYDLEKMFETVAAFPKGRIEKIGQSAEGRPLEVISLGTAPASIFLRARAHPWETGGSWVIQGLVDFLCSGSAEAEEVLKHISFHFMPMAAKDGVSRGMTRFTINGFDLNRGWGASEKNDPVLCPENYCLLQWFKKQQKNGKLPKLAICIHNDASGKLHLSHPHDNGEYWNRMLLFEQILRTESWFAEGVLPKDFRNPSTFGEGITERFKVDALIWELNANYAVGLNRPPDHNDWKRLGKEFALAVTKYINKV